MKNLMVFILLMLVVYNLHATVRTVSNNPDNLGQFNTIQAAIDASADSDTVVCVRKPECLCGLYYSGQKDNGSIWVIIFGLVMYLNSLQTNRWAHNLQLTS